MKRDRTGEASGLGVRDLVHEATEGTFNRPLRAALTASGTVLGMIALVATIGVSRTASAQIVDRFDRLGATEVRIVGAGTGYTETGQRRRAELPWDPEARLGRLNGVVAAGTLTALDGEDLSVRSVPVVDPRDRPEPVDLVMLDLTMPVMDGEQTLRALRDTGIDTPVLLMSGYDEQETAARFADVTFAGFVQKPFSADSLRAKLAEALLRRR